MLPCSALPVPHAAAVPSPPVFPVLSPLPASCSGSPEPFCQHILVITGIFIADDLHIIEGAVEHLQTILDLIHFSIASTIGRRSSSVKVCRESFRISYTLVGLNSLESLGARTFTNSLMNCSYCSSLRKPKIYWLTCFLYSDGLSVKNYLRPVPPSSHAYPGEFCWIPLPYTATDHIPLCARPGSQSPRNPSVFRVLPFVRFQWCGTLRSLLSKIPETDNR